MRTLYCLALVCLVAFTPLGCSKKSGKSSSAGWADRGKKAAMKPPTEATLVVAEAVAGTTRHARLKQAAETQSGILTAGSFDDSLDPRFFHSFLSQLGQDQRLGDLVGRLRGQRLVVGVKDEAGKPLGNARVKLFGDNRAVELTTRTDGRVIFILPWDQMPANQSLTVIATPNGGKQVTHSIPPGVERWEVTVPSASTRTPRSLDLAIVLDTTGSMADELEFLKTEFRGITAAVRKRFPEVEQRYALVLYRDEGDEYVTRKFDFTTSIDQFHSQLAAQSAAGGGDYPEAVHRALQEATQLRWRDQETARVLFWVADAPPHAQFASQAMDAANALRKRGVAIYPIACSGYDPTTELFMRSCALLTGSQFIFLTDDSGVGNSHGEPHIPFYQVQRLDRLMIRMIAGELSGRRIEPAPNEVLRTVGNKVN